jgi:DNA repair exonuclease SbcCD ATPase subunit
MPPLKPNDPTSGSSMASTSSTNAGHSITKGNFVAPENSFDVKAMQASSAWQTLEAALKNVSEHSFVFSNIAEAKDRHDARQVMLQERDKRIAELESASDFQLDQYGIKYTKWGKEKSQMEQKWSHERRQLEQRVVDLKNEMSTSAQETLKTEKAAHTKEATALRKQLDLEKKNVIALNEDLKKAKTKIQRVEEDLLSCTKKLSKWEQYLSELKDLDYNRV